MRRILREALSPEAEHYLESRQAEADVELAAGAINVDGAWKRVRQSGDFKPVLSTLQRMAGTRQRCMYCADSHGTDVEHFRPKKPFPDHMFRWRNLLLCCTECGRFKGNKFPVEGDEPMLVDPTADDPWQFLDFEPRTGIVMARYDRALDGPSPKGATTVDLLQLNAREAMNEGYRKTFRRLAAIVERELAAEQPDVDRLITDLRGLDDHGLLGWCFSERGRLEPPFRELHDRFPESWSRCTASLASE